MRHLLQRIQSVVVGLQIVRIERNILPRHREVRVAQKLLEPERVAASLNVQFGVGVPEQMDGRFLDASFVIVGPHCIPQCADGQLYAILRYKQQVRRGALPIY